MRSILSIIVGVVVGVFGVFLVEMINLSLYPIPIDLNVNDDAAMIKYITSLPNSAFLLVVIAHVLGGFISSFIAGMIARSNRINIGLITGSILLIFTIINIYTIEQPLVISLIDFFATVIAVIVGARLGASRIVS